MPRRGTWISWPRPEGISFPGKYHEAIEDIAGLIRVLAAREEVHLNVPNDNYERIVRDFLKARRVSMRRVFFHHIPTNEAWARDHGPAFVLRRRRGKTEAAIVDWGFNAWGGKYPPWDADDAVPTRIAEELKLPVFYPGHRDGRRRGRLQRRRHRSHHHVVPAEQEPQRRLVEGAS